MLPDQGRFRCVLLLTALVPCAVVLFLLSAPPSVSAQPPANPGAIPPVGLAPFPRAFITDDPGMNPTGGELPVVSEEPAEPAGRQPLPRVPLGPPRPTPAEPVARRAVQPEELPPVPLRSIETPKFPKLLDRTDPPSELIEFRDTPLHEACKLLSDQTGLKIVPSSAAGKVNVTLYLRDVRPGVALDALTKAHGLFYREDGETGIVRIFTTEEYEKDLGSFREEQTKVFTLLYPNPLEVAMAIQGAFGDRVQLTVNNQNVNGETISDLAQRFARFNLVDQQTRVLGGQNSGLGSFGGGGGFGGTGGFGGGFGGGGFGGIGGFGGFGNNGFNNFNQNNDGQDQAGDPPRKLEGLTPEQIQAIEKGGKAVDDLLRARKADIFVTTVIRNNQLIVRTADLESMERISELVAELDVPTPLVLLEVQVLALQLTDDFKSAFDYQFSDGNTVAGGYINNVESFTTGNILPPAADAGGLTRFEPLAPGPPGSIPNQNMTFQVVSSKFRMRLQMLESKNRVTQLATPLLLTANNEVSRIFIGQTIPVTLGFSPGIAVPNQIGGAGVVSQPVPITVPQNIGQSLLITPNINADRTVTLRVAQEDSSLVENGAKIPVVNGDVVQNLNIDVVRRNTVSGTIVAKDGLTVAIGGLIDENLTDTRQQVPILGKLPVVGIAFRGQQTGRQRRELVVLIRPYIFNTPHENAALSHDLISELSIHPHAPEAIGTMNSFVPPETLRADPPLTQFQKIFRFHSLVPKAY